MTKKGAGEKRAVGRPSDYQPGFCQAIQQHAAIIAEGGTDSAIAEALSVDVRTVYRWKDEHPEFLEACQAVKAHVDDRVEASLFKRGIGYSHAAVKIFMPTGAGAPVYADYTEHYPPDTAAASLWLRNRRPAVWRDRIEHTGADGGPLEISWQMPSPAAPGAPPVIEGDAARDITPQQPDALPEASLSGGEPIGVTWGDAASAKDSAKSAGPVTPTRPTRGDKP